MKTVAWLCACLLLTGAAPPKKSAPAAWEKLGGGSQALAGQAVRMARETWRPDACFAGLLGHFNGQDGSVDVMHFRFFSPGAEESGFRAAFSPGLAPEPSPELKRDYDHYCIREMSIDSGDAVLTAFKAGLSHGPKVPVLLRLRVAQDADSPLWTVKALRGRTVWIVAVEEGGLQYYIDAKTGRLIHKGSLPSSRAVRAVP
ncbi:MAG: hypothetical protein AAB320_03255 [Elusimicrobiota bacterium]